MAGILAGTLAWMLFLSHIRFTPTPSLTHRLFWSVKTGVGAKRFKHGDYVLFRQYVPAPVNRTVGIAKRVECIAGDTLRSDNNGDYYCNGRYLGRAKKYLAAGTQLRAFLYDGLVPIGEIFVCGDHKDSYDSRYFGFIRASRVEEQWFPIF